ncbi:MAG: oxidoreductase [Chitinophagaceae bacterium]
MKLTILAYLLFACSAAHSQTRQSPITILDSSHDCSIRGMSIPSNRVIWISGSNGHVAKSTDGGKTWKWMLVAGYEKTDFRAIHAFDSTRVIIMGVGNPAYILKTKDGGQSWKLVYTKDTVGMFLDAMDFRNEQEGICIGDPIDAGGGKKKFFVIRTHDGGDTWQQQSPSVTPVEGEAVFSASGSNIALLDSKDFDYAFISGGSASNLYLIGKLGKANKVYPLRINKGTESSGAFSMATDGRNKFYSIGGDYKNPDEAKDNFVWTADGGKSWQTPLGAQPSGYRSCIRIIKGKQMVACGTNGVDVCDEPNKWRHISAEGFNVCRVSLDGKMVFFGGGKGRVGRM